MLYGTHTYVEIKHRHKFWSTEMETRKLMARDWMRRKPCRVIQAQVKNEEAHAKGAC